MEDHNQQDHERNERERKQSYLINQIVVKGYNKAEFATHMNNLKANGTDIDLWTFDELVEAVEKFQIEQDSQVKSPEKECVEEESSEDEEMYRYLHPSEVEKIKQRNKKNLERLSTVIPFRSGPAVIQDVDEKPQFMTFNNNDQSGWEKDDINIDSLNVDETDFTEHVEVKPQKSDEKKHKKTSKHISKNTDKKKGLNDQTKNQEISDDFVEKALNDFFKNEDSDYDVIKPGLQQTVDRNEEVKIKVIDKMTPPSVKKPRYNMQKMQKEHEDPNSIHSFIAEVKTSKETKLLAEQNIDIKVLYSQYGAGSLFQYAYIEYTVVTEPFGWVTKRRESDFSKLRDYIAKVFPQYCLPPLITTKDAYNSKSLKEKELYFTKFLNEMLANEELRAGEYVEKFLTVQTEKEYKPIRKSNDKNSSKPNDLADYGTIDGFVNINVSPNNAELCKNFQNKFLTKYTSIFKTLEDATDEIEKNSIALSKSIQKYTECFDQLAELYSDVGFDEFTELYNGIRDLTQLYSENIIDQAHGIKSNLEYEFKYRLYYADSFKEINKLKNEVEYSYKKWNRDLIYKKDKLWSYKESKDYSKWNLNPDDLKNIDKLVEDELDAKARMLPRETELVSSKRYLMNYIENQGVKEIRRGGKLQWKSIKDIFSNISVSQCKLLNKIHVYWADFNMKFGSN